MRSPAIAVTLTACIIAACVCAQTPPGEKAQAPPPSVNDQAKAESPLDSQRTLRVISAFDSPPFAYKKGITRSGFEVDLIEALARELGAKVGWVEMNFNINMYASALDRGSADAAISSISITPDRKEKIAFSHPYYRASFAVAVKKDVDWQHNWFTSGLKGWKVGVMRNTTAESWARKNLDANVETYASIDRLAQALKNSKGALKSGRAGFCIMHDEAILKWVLSDYSYHFEIVERKIAQEDYGIAVSKGNTKLLTELNAALEKLRANGTYKKLRTKWYRQAEDLPLFNE